MPPRKHRYPVIYLLRQNICRSTGDPHLPNNLVLVCDHLLALCSESRFQRLVLCRQTVTADECPPLSAQLQCSHLEHSAQCRRQKASEGWAQGSPLQRQPVHQRLDGVAAAAACLVSRRQLHSQLRPLSVGGLQTCAHLLGVGSQLWPKLYAVSGGSNVH